MKANKQRLCLLSFFIGLLLSSMTLRADVYQPNMVLGFDDDKAVLAAHLNGGRGGYDIDLLQDSVPANSLYRNALEVLKKYYLAALREEENNILGYYFQKDGSRGRLISELKEIPDKFDGFKKLTAVEVLGAYKWGEYIIWQLQWEIENKRKVTWLDVVGCDNSHCGVSDLFFSGQDNAALVNSIIYADLKQKSNNGFDKSHGIGELFRVYSSETVQQDPLVVFGNITKPEVGKSIIDRKNVTKAAVSDMFEPVRAFAEQIWTLDNGTLQEVASLEATRNKFWSAQWHDFNASSSVATLALKTGDDEATTRVEFLRLDSLLSSFSSNDSLELLGSIKMGDFAFHFVRFPKYKSIYVLKTKTGGSKEIKLCAECGMFYVNAIVESEGLARYFFKIDD